MSSLGNEDRSGLLVIPEPFTNAHRDRIIAQSIKHKVPVPACDPAVGTTSHRTRTKLSARGRWLCWHQLGRLLSPVPLLGVGGPGGKLA